MIFSNMVASFIASFPQAPDYGKCKTGAKRMGSAKLPSFVQTMQALHRPMAPSRLPEYRHCRHITGKCQRGARERILHSPRTCDPVRTAVGTESVDLARLYARDEDMPIMVGTVR